MSARNFLMIFVVALVARGAWDVVRGTQRGTTAVLEFPDEQQYWHIAKSLAAGVGLRDELGFRAGRMPLYPAFLSLFTEFDDGLFFVRSVQRVLGALAACLTALIAARLGGRTAGLLAGLAVALDPFQIFFASLLLTEAPFTAALVLFLYVLTRLLPQRLGIGEIAHPGKTETGQAGFRLAMWLAAGAVAAICVYLRESSLGLVVLLLGFAATIHGSKHSWIGAGAACAVVAASLAPWALRNRTVLGESVLLTTRSGISLYDGLGPQADGSSNLADIKDGPQVRHLGELERNEFFWRESLRQARANPRRVGQLALVKAARTWSLTPNAEGYQSSAAALASAAWCIPLYAFALFGIVMLLKQRRGLIVALLLLPALYFTALHMIFVGSVRYRIPAMPMVEILAAFGICSLTGPITRRFNRAPAPAQQ